jgi:hypothetical protein
VSLNSYTYDCVDDIPMHYIRANQTGILLFIIAAVATSQPLVLGIPLLVQIITRTYGIKYNLFVRLLAPLFPQSSKTEARELLRFNNLLAILFLVGGLVFFVIGIEIVAYMFVAMLTIAVVLALSGFCLGCFMYFQWKQFRARQSTK